MPECLKLKKSNCKNCYKCIRHCPVKSIRFSANQAHIVDSECILCGHCFVVCPQNAKEITDETEKAKVLIMSGAPVYVSIAPSFIANYDGAGIEDIDRAVKKLGFAGAEETAVGAAIVKKEYDRMLSDGTRDILISSCCQSVNLLIQKYFPRALPYVADAVSPMQAHELLLKNEHPGARVVFVGPCVAKKDEAAVYPGIVDAVLTFEELSNWLQSSQIDIEASPERSAQTGRTRWFPTTGGILKSMECAAKEYSYIAVDGAENCIAALRDIEKGNVHKCFIEMSMCAGSCIGGPVMEKYHRTPVRDYIRVSSYAGKEDFAAEGEKETIHKILPALTHEEPKPTEAEITEILRQMGKTRPEDELNCGTCGYDTCRLKAEAVFHGKADLSMCLPFLKEKAESFSDNIINNTPNGIIVLNDNFEVQQINRSALDLMNLRSAADVLGEPVIRILDPKDFMEVRQSGRNIRDRKKYLADYRKYVEESVLYDREFRLFICIMRDITDRETERERKETLRNKTVETADNVVEKQMRIVQEIASLLGETAAETKVALAKLKESLDDE